MEKKYDISIHFSLKTHSIEEISQKFENWENSKDYRGQFDFSEREYKIENNIMDFVEPRSVLHHCFLPKKKLEEIGFSTDLYDDFLEMFSEDMVCWNGVSGYLGTVWDRTYMLENLKKCNGVAIFIGDIVDGVKEEYDIAQKIGVDIITIK